MERVLISNCSIVASVVSSPSGPVRAFMTDWLPKYDRLDGLIGRHDLTTSLTTSSFGKVTRRWNSAKIIARCDKAPYILWFPQQKDYCFPTQVLLIFDFFILMKSAIWPCNNTYPREIHNEKEKVNKKLENKIKVTVLAPAKRVENTKN